MIYYRIFRNLNLGIEWVLSCKAIDLESLRFIVSRLERVVETAFGPSCLNLPDPRSKTEQIHP